LYCRLFPEVSRREPYDITNVAILWSAPVAGNVGPADVDAMLSYLEAVLESLEQSTVPVIIAWPSPNEAPLLVAGETLKEHLDRVLGVLKNLSESQRQQVSLRLTSIIHDHYRAWLELIEYWKGEFPRLLPLNGYYPSFVWPTTYYRAVSDTRVTNRPFDRWTTSWHSAKVDLRWRHDHGPCPGIISITTHHAIGPFRDTSFSGEIDGAICCEQIIAAVCDESVPHPAPDTSNDFFVYDAAGMFIALDHTPDTGEYFIDSLTQVHCSAPGMAWPRENINDLMFAEMPFDASWTPDDDQPEPTSLPDEHLDDIWWAPQLRFCLREPLPPHE